MTKPLPTPEFLRELFHYNPKTGALKRRSKPGNWSKWNARYAGDPAGTKNPDGTITVSVNGRKIPAHRIAWVMTYGVWPPCIIHRNGNRSDNRLRNLKAVARVIVQRRRGLFRNNTSGVRGVYWSKADRRWIAVIKIDGKLNYLGSFVEKADAVKARRAAEMKRDRPRR